MPDKDLLLFIDIPFLNEAIIDTKNFYESMYNGTDERYPKVDLSSNLKLTDLINETLAHSHFEPYSLAWVYIFTNSLIDLNKYLVRDVNTHNEFDISCSVTDKSIWNELKNLILLKPNLKKIILVADNEFYAKIVNQYRDKIEFRLIRYKDTFSGIETEMPPNLLYQDVSYPLGVCLGLTRKQI